MSGYIDVEGMRSAASTMSGAAENMRTAASWMGDYINQFKQALSDEQFERQRQMDRQVALLAARCELESMVAHDAGLEGQAGRYAESAYEELRVRIASI